MIDQFDDETELEPIPKQYRVFVVIEEYDANHEGDEYAEIEARCLGCFDSSDEQWNLDKANELFNTVADDHT